MNKKVKLFHYGHSRALFCSRACREGFKEDRKSGLIYGPYFLTELNRFAQNAEEFSQITKTCPYCNTKSNMKLKSIKYADCRHGELYLVLWYDDDHYRTAECCNRKFGFYSDGKFQEYTSKMKIFENPK